MNLTPLEQLQAATPLVQTMGHMLDAMGDILRRPDLDLTLNEVSWRLEQASANCQDVVHRLADAIRKLGGHWPPPTQKAP
jgi:hypothetical protein